MARYVRRKQVLQLELVGNADIPAQCVNQLVHGFCSGMVQCGILVWDVAEGCHG